jgi:transposase InsO family protein
MKTETFYLRDYFGGNQLYTQTPTKIVFNGKSLSAARTLLDTGANGYIFMSIEFARACLKMLGLPQRSDFTAMKLGGFDGAYRQIVDVALKGHIRIQNRLIRNVYLLPIDMGNADLIIGRTFFEEHDILVDCRRRRLLFPPTWKPEQYDADTCMDDFGNTVEDPEYRKDVERRDRSIERQDQKRREEFSETEQKRRKRLAELEQAVRQRAAELERLPATDQQCQRRETPKQKVVRFAPTLILPSDGPSEGDSLEAKMERSLQGLPSPRQPLEGADGVYQSPQKREEKKEVLRDAQGEYTWRRDSVGFHKHRSLDLCMIAAAPFAMLARRYKEHGITSIYELDRIIDDKRREAQEREEEILMTDVRKRVPSQYHGFLDVFSRQASDKLPDLKPGVDHTIEMNGKTEDLGYSSLYRMSLEEAEACRKYIVEALQKGFIESSNAPWAAPVLFVQKPGGRGLRFCVDYRKLNALTTKDRYPLPLIDETMTRIGQAKFFTKIDIRQAFHRIRMDPAAEELTTFRTRYGAYKYKVLPFGLTNGPSTFQRYINDTLMGYLDDFCSAYIDDILIFSTTEAEHELHVKKVLERLRQAGLQADVDKCEFHVQKTKFLGFVIGVDGIAVDPAKIEAVEDWKIPTTVKGVQSFLGFCNFYRRFVQDYSRIAKPLNNLTKKETPFRWSVECQQAFDQLKRTLLSAPILAHFAYGKPTKMETDASDGVCAGVLSQQQEDGEWRPVGFYSETMHGPELNYSIQDKELMAVVRGLRFWRAELIGLQQTPFEIITDHEALIHFSTKRLLNLRQAGWAEILAQYNYTLTYRPGKENVVADALSRKAEDLRTQQAKKEAQRTLQIFTTLDEKTYSFALSDSDVTYIATLTSKGLYRDVICDLEAEELAVQTEPTDDIPEAARSGHEAIDHLLQMNKEDPELEVWREVARQGSSDFTINANGLLLRRGCLVVPEQTNLRTKVLDEVHARITSAHPGKTKTKKMVSQLYWWPKLNSFIDQYVRNCLCRAAKHPRDKTPGLLHPLPLPQRPWQEIAIDFKSMPKDKKGFDNVLVMIDRLSKASWLVPCHRTATAGDAAQMFYQGPWRLLGTPVSVVSDRGPQFVADFMNEVSKILKIDWKLASPGHSQTAGQAENLNQYLDQRLRMYVSHYQDDWSDALPAMDFVQNSTPHDSTGLQPHEVLMGFRMPEFYDWETRTALQDCPLQERLNRQEGQRLLTVVKGYVDYAKDCMQMAQVRQVEQANRHRREPDFDVGDYVRIIKKTWARTTDTPTDKLDMPLTPTAYKIIKKVGHSFELELPDIWKGHRVFHADRLRLHPMDPVPGQKAEEPDAEDVNGEREWHVQEVLASKVSHHKLWYQVQWKGWNPDPEWYLAESFKNSPTKLAEYHAAYPEKAGPPARLPQWLQAQEEETFCEPHADDNKPALSGGRTRLRRTVAKKS